MRNLCTYLLMCLFYGFGAFIHFGLKLCKSRAALIVKEYYLDPFEFYFVYKFVNVILSIISFLSIYRIFLYLI